MELFIIIVILIAGVIWLPKLLSSNETKLFRRIWGTERLGGPLGYEKQSEAFNKLCSQYEISSDLSHELLYDNIIKLLSAAFEFDNKNRINAGIQVTPIIALLLAGKVDDQDTLDMLQGIANMDVIAFNDSFASAMQSMSKKNLD